MLWHQCLAQFQWRYAFGRFTNSGSQTWLVLQTQLYSLGHGRGCYGTNALPNSSDVMLSEGSQIVVPKLDWYCTPSSIHLDMEGDVMAPMPCPIPVTPASCGSEFANVVISWSCIITHENHHWMKLGYSSQGNYNYVTSKVEGWSLFWGVSKIIYKRGHVTLNILTSVLGLCWINYWKCK